MKPEQNFRIKEIYAVTAIDPADNSEGVIGLNIGGDMIPAICADQERLKQIMPIIIRDTKDTNLEYRVRKFVNSVDVTEWAKQTYGHELSGM